MDIITKSQTLHQVFHGEDNSPTLANKQAANSSKIDKAKSLEQQEERKTSASVPVKKIVGAKPVGKSTQKEEKKTAKSEKTKKLKEDKPKKAKEEKPKKAKKELKKASNQKAMDAYLEEGKTAEETV